MLKCIICYHYIFSTLLADRSYIFYFGFVGGVVNFELK